MNRAERRAAARRIGGPKGATVSDKVRAVKKEEGAAMLLDAIAVNRSDAVSRLIGALFQPEVGSIDKETGIPKMFRLQGIGGATGVISQEQLSEFAQAAVFGAMLLPQEPEAEGGEDGAADPAAADPE